MSMKRCGLSVVSGGFFWLTAAVCAVSSASADDFFFAYSNPLSAKRTGVWSVQRGGNWVVISERRTVGQQRDVTIADPLELYRDPQDDLYYLPLPKRSSGRRAYNIRDYGFLSTRRSDWGRNITGVRRKIVHQASADRNPPTKQRN